MAIDTRNKRFSMINFLADVPWALPNPDGAISAADRAMLLNLYVGISLGEVVSVETPAARIYTVPAETRIYTVPARN